MNSQKTWVIVADGAVARLFELSGPPDTLVPQENHIWTAPRDEEFADAQGMTHSRVGPSRHRMAPHGGPDHQQLAFARDMAAKLETAQRDGLYEYLVIAAPPKMLGLLRDQLRPPVRMSVRLEIGKDLTNLPLEEIGAVLARHMAE